MGIRRLRSGAGGEAQPSRPWCQLAADRQAPRVAGAWCQRQGPEVDTPGPRRWGPGPYRVGERTVNSPRTSTGCVPSAVSTITGRPSASLEVELPVVGLSASCQPTSIFSATGRRHGSGPAPAAQTTPSLDESGLSSAARLPAARRWHPMAAARRLHSRSVMSRARACATTSTADRWPPRSTGSGCGTGWRCVDVGAGGGDVTVALAEIVGPRRPGLRRRQRPPSPGRGGGGAAAAGTAQVLAITQAGEDLHPARAGRSGVLPVPPAPRASTRSSSCAGWPARCGPAGGSSPRSRSPRPAGSVAPLCACPARRHPDIGALLPALVRDAGLELVDAWAEAPAGVGPGAGDRLPGARSPTSTRATTPWSCHRSSRRGPHPRQTRPEPPAGAAQQADVRFGACRKPRATPPPADLAAAAAAVEAGQGGRRRRRPSPGRAAAMLDAHQVVAYDLAHAAAAVENGPGRPRLRRQGRRRGPHRLRLRRRRRLTTWPPGSSVGRPTSGRQRRTRSPSRLARHRRLALPRLPGRARRRAGTAPSRRRLRAGAGHVPPLRRGADPPVAEHIHRANTDIPEEIIAGPGRDRDIRPVDPRGVRRVRRRAARATTSAWSSPPRSCRGARSGPAARSSPVPRSSPAPSSRAGPRTRSSDWLPTLASGEIMNAVAVTEPDLRLRRRRHQGDAPARPRRRLA